MKTDTSRAALMAEVRQLRQRVTELERTGEQHPPVSELELALRERVKELECLYAVSRHREQVSSSDEFLQSVVDSLPCAWQHPQYARSRIIYEQRQYVSDGFQEGPWRMGEELRVDNRVVGVLEVFYLKGAPAPQEKPFLREEYSLLHVVAERVSTALMQFKTQAELREANQLLRNQHQALQETNIALRTVLSRLEDEKREIRASILANIQKIIMPIVFELELALTGRQRSYATLLRQSLQEVVSPFLTQLARNHLELTPVEIAISTMIRNGLSTKEIAQLRCISAATVRRHRENIRHKLGLQNRKVNLVTYLQSSNGEDAPAARSLPARNAALEGRTIS